MVELPPEIIQHIIRVSTPDLSFGSNSRAAFLLPLCHLHSSLRRSTQRLLFSHVILDDPDQIALFLENVEVHSEEFDFGSCVESLEMLTWDDESDGADECLSRIVDRCQEIKEMRLTNIDEINFAHLSKLKKLRTLICQGVEDCCFEPIGESSPLSSLVELVFMDCSIEELVENVFFTSANLPSLRLLCADILESEDRLPSATLTFPSTLYAANLHHLRMAESDVGVLPLLLATRELRSLEFGLSGPLPFPKHHRFASPLIAIRIRSVCESEVMQEFLDDALESGLIDRATVISFPEFEMSSGKERWTQDGWWKARGMKAEWSDGDLEKSWASEMMDFEGCRRYTRWVDRVVANKIAVSQDVRGGGRSEGTSWRSLVGDWIEKQWE